MVPSLTKATGNSRSGTGIPRNPASQQFPAGIPGNFLIFGGNFGKFRKFNFYQKEES